MTDQVEDFGDLAETKSGGALPEEAMRFKAMLPDGRVLVMRRLDVTLARQIAVKVAKQYQDGGEDEALTDELVRASIISVGDLQAGAEPAAVVVNSLGRFYNLAVTLYAKINLTTPEETAGFLASIEAL